MIAVLFAQPLPVAAALHVLHPIGVVQVPLHGFANAGLEGLGGLPAQFAFDLACVYCVAPVMAGAVCHIDDLLGVGLAIDTRAQFVEQLADGVHDVDVGLFVPATHVVGLAQVPGFQHTADGAAVIFDVEPVADLHAVAIDGQGFAGQGVDDHERDELFREVVRPVVVAAVGGDHRQAVGVVPGAHQVVRRGFAGAVGTVGLVGVGFCKRWVVFGERAVDLVGADMQEAEGRLFGFRQAAPISAHGFEQPKGANDVGLDEVFGALDGAVHMAFGREVQHCAGPVLGQQGIDQGAVAQVALHEVVAGIALQAGQVLQVAGVGEFVEVDHGLVTLGQPVEHEVATNEAGAAGDDNHDLYHSYGCCAEIQ